jgi:hypothetical protein
MDAELEIAGRELANPRPAVRGFGAGRKCYLTLT